MIRFVPWSEVGTITVNPGDNVVEVGAFELAEGADTLWVRMTNTGEPGPWPWSYGILSFRTEEGQPLGSIKAYNSFDGEVFRLGVGLTPSVRAGVLTFEPRGFNMAWIRQGNPWSLRFEARSGGEALSNSFWNRDPTNGVLTPSTAGDDVHLGSGDLRANQVTADAGLTVGAGIVFTPSTNSFVVGEGTASRVLNYSVGTYYRLSDSDFNNPGAVPLSIERSTGGDTRVAFYGDGHAFFAGAITAPNVTFRSTDPALYRNDQYLGPELDLLDEIRRLETLVKHLYETLRLAPPAGWPVWDGSDDLIASLGTVTQGN